MKTAAMRVIFLFRITRQNDSCVSLFHGVHRCVAGWKGGESRGRGRGGFRGGSRGGFRDGGLLELIHFNCNLCEKMARRDDLKYAQLCRKLVAWGNGELTLVLIIRIYHTTLTLTNHS